VSGNEMRRAIIDRDILDYRRFSTFLKDHSGRIIEAVKKRLGFSDGEFWRSGLIGVKSYP
jgi:hypothetical protein